MKNPRSSKSLSPTQISPSSKPSEQPLPKGWRWVKLGDVCEINPRRPQIDRKDEILTSFIPMEAVDARSGTVETIPLRPFGEVKKGYTFFQEGDVLFAKITPCMQNGKHTLAKNLVGGFGFGTTEFHVLRAYELLLPEILWRFLRQSDILFDAFEHLTGAVGQQRLPADFLASILLPLPPLEEQKRLAGILTEQMAAVERARKAAQEQLDSINALPAAFLRQVFPQPEQPLPKGWRWVKLGDVISEAKAGFASGERDPMGVVQMRMNNVDTRGNFVWDGVLRVPADASVVASYCLEVGDVMFNNTNSTELVGKSAIFSGYDEPVVFSNHFTRLRTTECLRPDVLALWLNYQWLKGVFSEICNRWIGQSAVKNDKLLGLGFPLPPLEEQKRLAGILTEQMAAVEKARRAAQEQLDTINALPAAILRQAFKGEL